MAFRCDLGIAVRAHSQDDLSLVRRSARAASINTSLSTTVSFSFCWCNRNAVHVDSRCARFDRAISLEGNMAKKAKKAKKTAKKAAKKKKSKKK